MPLSNSLPASVIGSIRTVSAALDDIADAHKTLTAREIRIQALMAELITVVRGSTGTSAMLQRIQMALQKESQVFTSVSNVLKTRHDTAKNAINNVR